MRSVLFYSIATLALSMSVTMAHPPELVSVTARLDADELEVGNRYKIHVNAAYSGEFSASAAGIPAPILQISVPPSVRLSGKILKSFRDLAKNEFLQEPYERLLEQIPATIRFKLIKEPKEDEVIGLHFLAYVGTDSDKQSYFVRRTLALPVKANALAGVAEDLPSNWGIDKSLQIGDTADTFELPKANGTKVALSQYLGKKNIIVTTYRAFW